MNLLIKFLVFTNLFYFSFLEAKMANSLILIKGRCGDRPEDICRKNGVMGAGADAQNINTLISILKNAGVESAFVNGWNGTPGNFVLRSNGALAPYNPLTNDSEYAFCYKECPCPPYNVPKPEPCYVPQPIHKPTVVPQPCIPQPCIPQPCPPQPCPPQHHPIKPCVPVHCSSESSSEVCETGIKKCRAFPNKVVCVKKQPKRLPCGDKLCFEKEKISTVRTYEVCVDPRIRDPCEGSSRHRKIKVKVIENKAIHDIQFVELSRNISEIREGDCLFPDFLRCPEVLAKYAEFLARCYCVRPCFYVGGHQCNELFVELNCEFFRVAIRPKLFCSGRVPFRRIKLCPVYGRELQELIRKGLANVNLVVPTNC